MITLVVIYAIVARMLWVVVGRRIAVYTWEVWESVYGLTARHVTHIPNKGLRPYFSKTTRRCCANRVDGKVVWFVYTVREKNGIKEDYLHVWVIEVHKAIRFNPVAKYAILHGFAKSHGEVFVHYQKR